MIDFNCDMGEGIGNDEAIMPFISSANIACGYHAGDEVTMGKTIELCLKYDVLIGAHPGFNDKINFGRVPIQLNDAQLRQLLQDQLVIMKRACDNAGASLNHVKPHGAMYTMASKDYNMSKVIAQTIFDFDPKLIYYGLSGSVMISAAKSIGLKTASEAFADRTYQSDGTLTPRSHSKALIDDEEEAVYQVQQIVKTKSVTTIDNSAISLHADTICIHGDGANALKLAQRIAQYLDQGI